MATDHTSPVHSHDSSPSYACGPTLVDAPADVRASPAAERAELGERCSVRRQTTAPVRSHQRQVGASRRVLAALVRWGARARQRLALAQLGPLTLRDLGLSEADVWREARKAFWQP